MDNQNDHPNQTAFAVVTTSGPDKPGVSAAFFRVLGSYNVELVDVEQAIFSGRISLSAYVRVDSSRVEAMEKGLRNTLSIYAQSLTVELRADEATSRPRSTHVVVVLGRQLNASHVSAIAQELANFNANIDRIRGLSTYPLNGLELYITVEGSLT
ncbi:ACT domain-containing protein [Corynebacterium sp. FDAARGOS 1242]|uniref:ACT domain-containing protein n=1 Tax=Corynebacterium sp. FDAARGOS 1242 TaxID=2778078 RepID=UPI001EF1BD2F|nr:ACT domain-containing protein [Corynebacterium sp. FDAARGOS 1242]